MNQGEQLQDTFRALSGSQESNASNGVQIGAKTKKLWPLEDNCTKLKDNFATYEIFASHVSNLRNLPM